LGTKKNPLRIIDKIAPKVDVKEVNNSFISSG